MGRRGGGYSNHGGFCDCGKCKRTRARNRAAANDGYIPYEDSGTRDGERWTADDGTTHTVNSTSDPQVPGGYYHSQTDEDGDKATAVFNEDGSLADIKQNKGWK